MMRTRVATERAAAKDLLCQLLRGESVVWPEDAEALLETAQQEGVHLLAAHRLRRCGPDESCPRALRDRFDAALREEAAIEQLTRRELRAVIAALHDEGVRPLIFKGAALSVTHYPDPVLRPRVDVDLLVRYDEVRNAARIFERLGYRCSVSVTGELIKSLVPNAEIDRYLVSSQIPYSKTDRYGVTHAFDLHWKISIPQVFANLLSMRELAAGAIAVPALGEAASAIGPAHALAIACIHRVAHHHGDDRLIWLYDVHLLAGALRASEADEFLRLAATKRISAVCAEGLSLAQQKFGTRLLAGLLENLRSSDAGTTRQEASAIFLRPSLRKIDVLVSDLAALETWRQQLRLIREHVFPPATYMHQVYGTSGRPMLPVLYAWRFIEGARAWFRAGADQG